MLIGSINMREIKIERGKFHLQDNIEAVLEGKVKKIGNGGMILALKKYIGRNVYVIIRKDD